MNGKRSQHLIDGRRVELFVPSEVRPTTPILLAHDGQNCFDGEHSISGHGWRLDEAAIAASQSTRRLTPIILAPWSAGSGRTMEYTPEDLVRANPELLERFRQMHGDQSEPRGNAYLRWCVEQLLPWASGRTGVDLARERTAVLGSSMGGLISLYAIARHPEVFESALCLSTHWLGGGAEFTQTLVAELPKPGGHRLWFDYGDQGLDAAYAPLQAIADQELELRGWSGRFVSRYYPNADHSEVDWANRADEVLAFWLGDVR